MKLPNINQNPQNRVVILFGTSAQSTLQCSQIKPLWYSEQYSQAADVENKSTEMRSPENKQ